MITVTRKNKTLTISPEPEGLNRMLGYMHTIFTRDKGKLNHQKEWRSFCQSTPSGLVTLPGVYKRVVEWLDKRKLPYNVVDEISRIVPTETCVDWECQRETGLKLLETLKQGENGLLIGPCGMGKTYVIKGLLEAFAINGSNRGKTTPTLITCADITGAKHLFEKLTELLGAYLNIGILCSAKKTKPQPITIVTNDSLQRLVDDESYAREGLSLKDFKIWIADEVHSLPTPSILPTLVNITAGVRYGLTATLKRSDGADVLLEGYFGPILEDIHYQEAVQSGDVTQVRVALFPVPYVPPFNKKFTLLPTDDNWKVPLFGLVHYHPLHSIIRQIDTTIDKEDSHLIFAQWIRYCKVLKGELTSDFKILHAQMPSKEADSIKAGLKDGSIKRVITTDVIQKAFDVPSLRYVTMAATGSYTSKNQRAGRVTRICEGKQFGMVNDFVHLHHPILFNQSLSTIKYYKANKWDIRPMFKMEDLRATPEKNRVGKDNLKRLEDVLSS